MLRPSLVALTGILALFAPGDERPSSAAAWPMLVRVNGIGDQPTPFRAFSRGAELMLQTALVTNPTSPLYPPLPRLERLSSHDTLRATAPASYPLDLSRGTVTFYTVGQDSLRVSVGRNPYGMVQQVAAVGRRLTVRLVRDSIRIDAR